MRGHGANNDCIETIEVCNKNGLHNFERANWEGTGDVGVHCTSDGIDDKFCETKHILHGTYFMWGEIQSTSACAATMLSCLFHVEAVLDLCWRMCPLLVAVEQFIWFLMSDGERPGMVASSSLWPGAPRSVADGGEYIYRWM